MSGPVNVYTEGTGTASISQPVMLTRAPTATVINYPIGQIAVVRSSNTAYILSSKTTANGVVSANWTTLATAAGDIDSITTQDSTVVTPTAGNVNLSGAVIAAGTTPVITSGSGSTATINVQISQAIAATDATKIGLCNFDSGAFSVDANGFVTLKGGTEAIDSFAPDAGTNPVVPSAAGLVTMAGTANQITTTGGLNTLTFSLPSAITAPGSLTTTTTLTATLGAITATNGNLVLGTAGNKILSTSVATTTTAGANSFGSVVLVGGTATVNTSAVTASSLIIISRLSIGATGAAALGHLSVGTITAPTSFVINSLQAADATALQASDVSKIMWVIIN